MTAKSGNYKIIYAIAKESGTGPSLLGIKGQTIEWISLGAFGVFVSSIDVDKIRPQRIYLEEFQRAMTALVERCSIIPMSFGSISLDLDSLILNLNKMEDSILEKLKHTENCLEIGMKITLPEISVLEFVASIDPVLQKLKDFYRDHPSQLSQDARIDIGRKVEASLKSYRNQVLDTITAGMQGTYRDIRTNPGKSAHEIIDACFLVEKSQREVFEKRINHLAALIPDREGITIVVSSASAPFNFAAL